MYMMVQGQWVDLANGSRFCGKGAHKSDKRVVRPPANQLEEDGWENTKSKLNVDSPLPSLRFSGTPL